MFKQQPFFRYDQIASNSRRFRVVTLLSGQGSRPIRCQLSEYDLDHGLQFRALSYTWGRSEGPRWIRVNDKPFFIQPSLYEALAALRKDDGDLLLWVDALCIDQTNLGERTHQVGLMGDIYRSASVVILWLGPATAQDGVALDDMTHDLPRKDLSNDRKLRKSYLGIGNKPYWRRAWIRQELLLAKQILVYCGNKNPLWDVLQLRYGAALFYAHLSGDLTGPYKNSISSFYREVHPESIVLGIASLEELLATYGLSDCQDVRDRIYALLSLATDCRGEGKLVADYEIEPILLFFAILEFCKPKQPLVFSQHLGSVLKLCVDEVTCVIEDPELLRQECQKSTPLTSRSIRYLETVRRELSNFKTNEFQGSSDEWTEVCQTCCRDFWCSRDCSSRNRIFQIGDSDFAITVSPAFAGFVLHGFLKEIRQNRGKHFTPTEEWNGFVRDQDERIEGHRVLAGSIPD